MQHYIFRSTTEKLGEHMEHIVESGDRIIADPTFCGGRDWVLLCRKGEPTVSDLTRAELVSAIAEGIALSVVAFDPSSAVRSGIQAGLQGGQ